MDVSLSPRRPAPTPRRRLDVQLLVALLVALLLWSYGIERRSLWFDEFHSLHHDRQPDLGSFFESVRSDNHPPLSFLLQRISLGVFGESALALRLPTFLVGLGLLLMTWHVGRRLPDLASRRHAVWIVVFSSFCFDVFTEARMYGLLCLSVLGLLESLLAANAGRRSRWWGALWVFIGLHSHYYFFHSLILAGLVVLVLALRDAAIRRRLVDFIGPLLVGCLGFVPWAIYGFAEQLGHGLPPGGNYRGLNAFAQSIGHLFYLNASAGGALTTYAIALPGTLLAAVFGALGLQRLWRSSSGSGAGAGDARLFVLVILALGLGVPVWSHGISLVYERASYGWRYIAGSLVPIVFLVATGMAGTGRWRRSLRGLFLASLATVTLVVALDGGRENYRGAVTHILRAARAGDAVLTRPLWELEPEHSPTAWRFYALRVPRGATQFVPTEIRLEQRRDAFEFERVWVYTRDLRHLYVLEELRQRFENEVVWPKGRGMVLHLFWNGPRTEQRIGAGPGRDGIDSSRASH